MGLLDKLVTIGNAIDQATKYQGPETKQNPSAPTLSSVGIEMATSIAQSTGIDKKLPIPISELVVLGGAFAQMAPSLQNFANDFSRNGMSSIPVKSIAQDALKQVGIDTTPLSDALGGIIPGSQTGPHTVKAVPKSIPLNPAMLMTAAMLATIEKKLDDIKETQQAILSFLEQDKQAEQQANLQFLTDTLNGYKYNWDNEQYKQNHHVKALDIKQASDKNIWFYYSQISDVLMKMPSFQMDQAAKNTIRNLESKFDEYRMAIYQFGFSSFLEMLLLGNFQQQYLEQIAQRVEKYNNEYRQLYGRCMEVVKKFSESTVETRVLTGIGNAGKALGKLISSAPVGDKSKVDEWLQNKSDQLMQGTDDRVAKTKSLFCGSEETGAYIFVDSIRNISAINNKTKDISFDGDTMILNME